jgi:hypothetical protein
VKLDQMPVRGEHRRVTGEQSGDSTFSLSSLRVDDMGPDGPQPLPHGNRTPKIPALQPTKRPHMNPVNKNLVTNGVINRSTLSTTR